MKTVFKSPEGHYKLDHELQRHVVDDKDVRYSQRRSWLNNTHVDLLDSAQKDAMVYVTVNTQKNILVYNISENESVKHF
jgi:hypothetical protein